MKRFKFALPLVLGAMALTGCNASGSLPLDISDADRVIDTPWTDYAVPASSVSFPDDELSISIEKEKTFTYHPALSPRDASLESLDWESGDVAVATINKGVLTAVGGGQTTISVSSNGESVAELEVDVFVTIADMDLIANNVDLDYGETYDLLANIEVDPLDTTQLDFAYSVSKEGVLEISEEGLITAGNEPGNAVITISNANLDKTLEFNVVVSDHTNYAASVAIAGESEVEITKSIEFTAEVTPEDTTRPITHEGVIWSVANKDNDANPHASISEEGVLEGLSEGEVTVTATSKDGKKSDTKDVTVFEVKATALDLGVADINLSNIDKTYHVVPTFTTDTVGRDEPSINDLVYESSEPSVATVSEAGFITASAPGTAEVSVSSERYNLSEKINVNVEFYVTAVTLQANKTTCTVGDEITVTALVNPTNATTDEFEFNIEGDIIDKVQENNTVTFKANDAGNVVVIAHESISDVSSNPLTIKVNEPDFNFGSYYLVGNHTFKGGTSIADSDESWVTARRALEFVPNGDIRNNDDEIVGYEYKAEIKFNANDQWLVRTAGDEESSWYKPTRTNGAYIESTPFTDGSFSVDYSSGNVVVNEGGKYEIYFKRYIDNDWFEVYTKHADFIIEPSSLRVGVDVQTTLKVSYWTGPDMPQVSSSDPTIVSIVGDIANDGTVTIKSLAAGEAVITAYDPVADKSVTSTITVRDDIVGVKKAIYLNANGEFDVDGVSMFAHSWDSANKDDNQNNQILFKAKMSDGVTEQSLVYTVDIPENHDSVVFTRGPAEATTLDWDEIYEQTEDIALSDDIDMWTMTGRGQVNEEPRILGSLGTYNPDIEYKIHISSGFGLKFANGDEYAGVKQDEPDYQGREQYKIENVHFLQDVEFTIFDFKNQVGWVDGFDEGSNASVTIVNGKYVSSEDFTADVYLKIAYENNGIYIGPAKSVDPENNFDESKYYVVGSASYVSGTSASGESWNDAEKAFVMSLHDEDKLDGTEHQYKATITFNADDEWRIRSKAYPVDDDVTIENDGALASNPKQMEMNGSNIHVNTAGKYDIYFKVLTSGKYSIYVSEKIEEGGGGDEEEKVTVTLQCTKDVGDGFRIYLVGDFSSWKINANAIAFEWDSTLNGWKAVFEVDKGTSWSCKLVKGAYNEPAESPLAWESDPNRTLTFNATTTITLTWQE